MKVEVATPTPTPTRNARAPAAPPALHSFSEAEPDTPSSVTAYHRKLAARAPWEQLADSLPSSTERVTLGQDYIKALLGS